MMSTVMASPAIAVPPNRVRTLDDNGRTLAALVR
jgi:hypothetical protein